jgi:hypothetical protein
VGRPTKYRREYPALAAVLRARGYTEGKVAEVLRVGPSTLSDWKRSYPEFARALDADQCEPDVTRNVEVEDATDGDFRLSKVEGFRLAPPAPSTAEPRRRFDDYDAGQAALDRRERSTRPTRARGM